MVDLVALLGDHPVLTPLLIVVLRFVCIVVAPLPGAPVAFASMVLLPWQEALLYNLIGGELGAIAAFYIARRWREPAVARLAPLARINEWLLKVSHARQFFAFVGLRSVSIVAFDFVSYAAGLSTMRFSTFVAATLVVDLPLNFFFFYLGGVALSMSIYIYAGVAGAFLAVVFLWPWVRRTILRP